MSVLGKIWKIKNETAGDSLLQKLLANRGLAHDDTAMERFFHPTRERDFHDPFLMKDMERAVARIGQAIEKSERIMIFGDYDVDGITGTAILMRALAKLRANVSYRLPHRIEDGYGLREKFIKEFSRLDVKIVITVDNGISCFYEVEAANAAGIDVIISDHHTVPEKIPNAYAILHPKVPGSGYPFAELCGAGVALKLAQALYTRRLSGNADEEMLKLLDFACMGTIADCVPLIGENRFIVKEGLKTLENTRWPGLSRLKENAGVKQGKISTHAIGFLLGPRINAAGRISHASHALKLLLHDAEHSVNLAQNLETLNRKRQSLMEELMEKADALAAAQCGDALIIIHDLTFHAGVIGLIASKISEKYFRPAIVMEDRGEILVGSCRSIPAINIVEILKSAADGLLTHYGGHAAAAGFEILKKNLPEFIERTKFCVQKLLRAEACLPVLEAECELNENDISAKTVEVLQWFEPFGVGNEVPSFLCRGLSLIDFSTVGSDKKHLKLIMAANGMRIDGIGFRLGQFATMLKAKKSLDLVGELEENHWNGQKKIQLKVLDFAL